MPERLTVPTGAGASNDPYDIRQECRTLFIDQLVRILRGAASLSPEVVTAFREGVGQHFDDMAAKRRKSGFAQEADGLTASRITLMGDSDLEVEIRLADMTRRLTEAGGGELWRTFLRFQTLLWRPDLDKTENPVGPEAVCAGLTQVCSHLGATVEETLNTLDRFEDELLLHLPELYREINQLLEQRRVDAAVPQVNAPPAASRALPGAHDTVAKASPAAPVEAIATAPKATPATEEGLPVALQQRLVERLLERVPQSALAAGQRDYLEGAPRLPETHPKQDSGSTRLDAGQVDALLKRLEAEDHPAPILDHLFPDQTNAPPPADVIRQSAPSTRPIRAKDIGLTSGTQAAASDAIGLIFESIFSRPHLPAPIKMALASLQIPMLKLAITDPDFFAVADHPLRALLNLMAKACIGLPPDAAADHPVCQALQSVAAAIRTHGADLAEQLPKLHQQVDALILQRNQAALAEINGYLPLAARIDRDYQMQAAAKDAIASGVQSATPVNVAAFLKHHWLRILIETGRRHGVDSPEWKDALAVIPDLQWSILPKVLADDRKRLLSLVPGLLRRINAGLDRVELPAETRTAFLDLCFNLQTAALKGHSLPLEDANPLFQGREEQEPSARLIKDQEVQILVLNATQPAQAQEITALQVGHWISFVPPDGNVLCGFVGWHSPTTGAWLITNPDWKRAVYLSQAMAEQLSQEGRIQEAGQEPLFDSAVGKVLSELS